jgi:phosphoribosyl-AMP cyclohydrolase / phosphoribosyl-ATP pyrophosphohydrolase
MMIFQSLFRGKKNSRDEDCNRIRIGEHTVCLNSRGRIPVILQRLNRKKLEIFDLVYMNQEALKLSLETGEVHVFRRSKSEIEKLIEETGQSYSIGSIKIAKNRRALLMTIKNGNFSGNYQSFIHEVDFENRK